MSRTRFVARMRQKSSAHRALVRNSVDKRPLERTKCRFKDTMKIYVINVKSGVWTGLIWHRMETNGWPL